MNISSGFYSYGILIFLGYLLFVSLMATIVAFIFAHFFRIKEKRSIQHRQNELLEKLLDQLSDKFGSSQETDNKTNS